MNRNILILFMSWLGVTGYGQATSPNETPITIARQGSFAVGGTVLHRPGKYDNSRFINWSTPIEQGQSYHADHAVIDFQIPTKAHQMPLVFVHGYGQSGRCWQMTPDGREGFQT